MMIRTLTPEPLAANALTQTAEREWTLSGHWTVHRLVQSAARVAASAVAEGQIVLAGTT